MKNIRYKYTKRLIIFPILALSLISGISGSYALPQFSTYTKSETAITSSVKTQHVSPKKVKYDQSGVDPRNGCRLQEERIYKNGSESYVLRGYICPDVDSEIFGILTLSADEMFIDQTDGAFVMKPRNPYFWSIYYQLAEKLLEIKDQIRNARADELGYYYFQDPVQDGEINGNERLTESKLAQPTATPTKPVNTPTPQPPEKDPLVSRCYPFIDPLCGVG